MSIGALILAAGLSSRMGAFKPMLELAGKTLIEHTLAPFVQFGCNPVMVVTGREAAALECFLTERFAGRIRFVRNPEYAVSDMFASVKIGIKAMAAECDGFFLIPADMPLIDTDLLSQMTAVDAPVVRPSWQGRAGHPVLLRQSTAKRVLEYNGDHGLKGALRTEKQLFVNAGTQGILLDADTPEDLRIIETCLQAQQTE